MDKSDVPFAPTSESKPTGKITFIINTLILSILLFCTYLYTYINYIWIDNNNNDIYIYICILVGLPDVAPDSKLVVNNQSNDTYANADTVPSSIASSYVPLSQDESASDSIWDELE